MRYGGRRDRQGAVVTVVMLAEMLHEGALVRQES